MELYVYEYTSLENIIQKLKYNIINIVYLGKSNYYRYYDNLNYRYPRIQFKIIN
jgi:hypothetical protein